MTTEPTPVEVNEIARQLELERSDRASSFARDAETKAIRLAEDRVRRQTIVDNRLDGHDQKFNDLNGNISRLAKAVEELKTSIIENLGGRKAVIELQNKQIALVAAIGGILYVVIQYVH